MKFLKCLIKCQSYARRLITSRTNLHKSLKTKKVGKAFREEIQGYHLMNEEPLKEARWEEINRNIVAKYVSVTGGAYGSHKSGIDNTFSGQGISNKTTKLQGKTLQLSSYSLGKVSCEISPGDIKNVINEIQDRDKSFKYYSILIRDEHELKIEYMWYLIPRDYYLFDVAKFNWSPMMGRTKRTKGRQLGWHSLRARIIFSMGSQLWFHFEKNEIQKYLLHNVVVKRESPILSYRCLYKLFNNKRQRTK